MPNDENWQRRSDEWVKMTHESRLRKEKELAQKKLENKQKKKAPVKKTRSKKSPSKS